MESRSKKIQVIIGSTRPKRIGKQIVEWILSVISDTQGIEFEVVDLATWNLPLLDEPEYAALGNYVHEHTKAWSKCIASADGYIFVTPQYNWGYPASLKNAIDFLYKEWNHKPAVIISYAHRGGGKAAAQLRQVLEGLKMRPAATMPGLITKDEMLGSNGEIIDPENTFAAHKQSILTAIEELQSLLN